MIQDHDTAFLIERDETGECFIRCKPQVLRARVFDVGDTAFGVEFDSARRATRAAKDLAFRLTERGLLAVADTSFGHESVVTVRHDADHRTEAQILTLLKARKRPYERFSAVPDGADATQGQTRPTTDRREP